MQQEGACYRRLQQLAAMCCLDSLTQPRQPCQICQSALSMDQQQLQAAVVLLCPLATLLLLRLSWTAGCTNKSLVWNTFVDYGHPCMWVLLYMSICSTECDWRHISLFHCIKRHRLLHLFKGHVSPQSCLLHAGAGIFLPAGSCHASGLAFTLVAL